MGILISIMAGLVCGVISGFGIGGGSLLMLWLTSVAGLSQAAARGINLLYFLPTAGAGLILHTKNRFVRWSVAVPAAIAGAVLGGITVYLTRDLSSQLLQKLFGGFLLTIGCMELLCKKEG